MSKLIYRLYLRILWIAGFPAGEYITFMLKRQERRFGIKWWLLIAITQSYAIALLHAIVSTGWFVVLLYPVNITILILVWHVVNTADERVSK